MFTATWFKDSLERIAKSALQGFIAALILQHAYGLNSTKTLIYAGVFAGLTALKSVVGAALVGITPASWVNGPRTFLIDAGERLVFTFIEGFASAMLIDSNWHLSSLRSAVLAGAAAGLSFLTSLLSAGVPGISPASIVTPAKGAPAVAVK